VYYIFSLRWQKSVSESACREIEPCVLNASEIVLLLHVDMEQFIHRASVITSLHSQTPQSHQTTDETSHHQKSFVFSFMSVPVVDMVTVR